MKIRTDLKLFVGYVLSQWMCRHKMHLKIVYNITKMIYKCTQCNYCTQRLCDLRRHENKKIPCNVQSRYGIVT